MSDGSFQMHTKWPSNNTRMSGKNYIYIGLFEDSFHNINTSLTIISAEEKNIFFPLIRYLCVLYLCIFIENEMVANGHWLCSKLNLIALIRFTN